MASIKFTDSQSKKLKKLGISDEWDLLLHIPARYIDETEIKTIDEIQPGELSQIQGTIVKTKISYAPRKNLSVHIKDETGEIQIRFLNFYPSQIKQLKEGALIRVFGEVKVNALFYEMVHPQYKIINEDGLRYSDEFVRHKILDAVGDLYMLGSPIIGKFTAYKSGHELNNKLLRALVENPQSWSLENLDDNDVEMAELAKNYLSIADEFNNERINKIQ